MDLRAYDDRAVGLVANLSGIFSKQACHVLSNRPSADGYRFEDVTEAVAARDLPMPLHDDYTGPATIVGYTVVFQGGTPSHAIAVCDTPDGGRTVVRTGKRRAPRGTDAREHCGRSIDVASDGDFRPRP